MNFCMFASIFSMVSLPYYVMCFLEVPVDSGIIVIFAPASIHPDCFALSANFSLNILIEFDYPSNISGILRNALLNILMPVVDV